MIIKEKGKMQMRREHNKESGMLIVEASLVFPVMFFAIIFLIYTGNVFYMRSQVDSAVVRCAIEGAALCADPLLNTINKEGSVPTEANQIKPYRYFTSMQDEVQIANEKLEEILAGMGDGFFAGMNLQQCSSEVEMKNYFLFQTVHASASYNIKFPIRFIFSDEDYILDMESKYIATVNDNAEFINNVDMIIDYYEATGTQEKVNGLKSKLGDFFKGNSMNK